MKYLFRLLTVVLLLAWSSPDALAQSSPPPNPNYTRFNTKADGDIPTPAANSVNLFFNGTGFRFKDEAAAFTNIGGIGVGVGSGTLSVVPQFGAGPTLIDSKMTTSGGSSGTWTLYDTGATGITQLVLKSGAHQEDVATPQLRIVNAAGTTPGNYGLNARADATLYITGSHFVAATSTNTLSGMFAGRFSQYKDGDYVWSNSSVDAWPAAAVDTGLARSAPGIVKVTDGSTGQGGIGISDSAIDTVSDALILRHATSDTAAASFGTGLVWEGENAGGVMHPMTSIDAEWLVATDGSELSQLVFKNYHLGSEGTIFTMFQQFGESYLAGAGDVKMSAGSSFQINAGSTIYFNQVYDAKWLIAAPGSGSHFIPGNDNTYDIGTSSAKVKDIYASTSIQGTRTKTLTDNTITDVVQISSTAEANANGVTAGYLEYTIVASDATTDKVQTETGKVPFLLVNENGTVTVTLGTPYGTAIDSAGGAALANTFASSVSGTDAKIRVTSNYDQATLTGTVTHDIRYRVVINSGTATVTPQ